MHTAADLDLDGADELILAPLDQWRTDGYGSTGEIWIYRGGENFRTDSPSVILRSGHGYNWRPYVAQLDSDMLPDLLMYAQLEDTPAKVLWGEVRLPREGSTWQALPVGLGYWGSKGFARIDGDSLDDLIGYEMANDSTDVFRVERRACDDRHFARARSDRGVLADLGRCDEYRQRQLANGTWHYGGNFPDWGSPSGPFIVSYR